MRFGAEVLAVALLAAVGAASSARAADDACDQDCRDAVSAEIAVATGAAWDVRFEGGTSQLRHLRAGGGGYVGGTSADRAQVLIDSVSGALFDDPAVVLRQDDAQTDTTGWSHVRFVQEYDGVPVLGGAAIAHLEPSGALRAVDFELRDASVDSVVPSLSSDDALDALLVHLQEAEGRPLSSGTVSYDHDSRLVVFPTDDGARLAYDLSLPDLAAEAVWMAVVDAEDGSILRLYDGLPSGIGKTQYSNTQSIRTRWRWDLQTYVMEAASGPPLRTEDLEGVECPLNLLGFCFFGGNYPAVPITSPNNVFGNHFPGQVDTYGSDAHFNADVALSYFDATFDRQSYDGAGAELLSYVNYGGGAIICPVQKNAFWFDDRIWYVHHAFPYTVMDVTAHEMVHGVTQHSANLEYLGESGALNESMSDVFGTLVEHYAHDNYSLPGSADWAIGERAGPASRRLDAPHLGRNFMCDTDFDCEGDTPFSLDDQPDHYNELWTNPQGMICEDNGGVHINSGIPNYAFYCLAEGCAPHQGGEMEGISKEAAGDIWYLALTQYLMSQDDFHDACDRTVEAAEQLFGTGAASADAVRQAWALVGVCCPSGPPENVHPGYEAPPEFCDTGVDDNCDGIIGDCQPGEETVCLAQSSDPEIIAAWVTPPAPIDYCDNHCPALCQNTCLETEVEDCPAGDCGVPAYYEGSDWACIPISEPDPLGGEFTGGGSGKGGEGGEGGAGWVIGCQCTCNTGDTTYVPSLNSDCVDCIEEECTEWRRKSCTVEVRTCFHYSCVSGQPRQLVSVTEEERPRDCDDEPHEPDPDLPGGM